MKDARVWETIVQFNGLDTEAHPASRDAGLLQVDEGSCHEKRGVWKPRRGQLHANVTKKAAAVSALLAFDLAGGDSVALVGSSTNVYSEASFDQ